MSRKVVLGVAAAVGAAGAVAFVFLIVVMVRQGLQQAGAWAGPLAALAGIVAAVAAVLVLVPRKPEVEVLPEPEAALPPEPEVPEWVVDRPAELVAVINALVDTRAGMVGITTGLYGAGGFGKTVLAKMACADRRVWQWFGGRTYLVTVGRDVRGAAAIAAKVNDVIKLVTGQDASFTDPLLAGQHLGSVLDAGPRRLLVLDDVWEAEQLAPFTQGGRQCARLVTTRVPELLAGRGPAVLVDQMSDVQARAVLTAGLPPLAEAVVAGLLAVTGRWPLLLRLVNKILADYARVAAEVDAQGAALVEQLRAGGPAVVDEVLGEGDRTLDVGQPQQRERAVRATIEASTGLLSSGDAERFAELGVFAEDEVVPIGLVTRLWQATARLDELRAVQVVRRLAQLALVSQAAGLGGGVAVHDVIRDFLRARLGPRRLAGLHGVLVDVVAAGLPAAGPLDGVAGCAVPVAWWKLGGQDRYVQDHLIEHLYQAGRVGQAEAVACDLRWVGARLERFGPAAPAADLAAAGTPRAARLRAALVRTAHLLGPTEPAGAVVDVLHSRVAEDPDWGPQVAALHDSCRRPRLVSRWPLPDLAHPALRRVLNGHTGWVTAVTVAPDGSWLASGGDDRTVRIWDAATGQERATLSGHAGRVAAVAVAPDGSWLASAGWDGTVRIWDAATRQERAVLTGHADTVDGGGGGAGRQLAGLRRLGRDGADLGRSHRPGTGRAVRPRRPVAAVAVAPDGSWLASGGGDGTVRIWDVATGRERAVLTGHTSTVAAVAVAPDGTWLASGSWDRTVRIWDAATRQERAVLTGHIDSVFAVAIVPDGSWLVSAGDDQTVRIWDVATGRERAVPSGHTSRVAAVAVASDGSWLASASWDRTVRIWDVATGRERAVLTGHTSRVAAVAVAPDGTWLASGSWYGTVRIWDAATRQERAKLDGHTSPVFALAVAPDGSWLVSAGDDQTVRIWDAATGRERAMLTGHADRVAAVAVASDGSWLASASWDRTVRIWDTATRQEQAVLTGHGSWVAAVAVAPDGNWLASAGGDGTVRIWDTATRQERAVLTGHVGPVYAVAVAPDGSWLATAGEDRAVRIWDTASGHAQAMMRTDNDITTCAWLGSNALVLGGSAGLYLFGLLAEPNSPAAAWQ